jgi:hypothetical protein
MPITELLAKLLAKYAEFQRRRPNLPQGDLCDLSEQEFGSSRHRISARQGG